MSATLEDLTQRLEARRSLPPPKVRRALRLAAGASQADVGEVVGVTRQSVSLWEVGSRTPRGQNLEAYLDVLRALRVLALHTTAPAP
jgi:DNA-binding XRE family transcriptional regulator